MTTTFNEQDHPRQSDGQFANKGETASPSVNLLDMATSAPHEWTDDEIDAYNSDGSYLYPPMPVSAKQHIRFWERVPVPDEIMRNVEVEYVRHRNQTIIKEATKNSQKWKEEHPDPGKRTYAATRKGQGKLLDDARAWEQAGRAEWDRFVAEQFGDWPEKIGQMSMRPVIRAWGMWNHAGPLPAEEQAVVDRHVMRLPKGDMTVADIVKVYRLSGIKSAMRSAYSEKALDQIHDQIAKLNEKIHDQR